MLVQDTDIFNDLQLDQELHEVLHHMMRSLERIQPIKLVDDGVEDLDINHEMFYETKLFRLLDPEFDQDKINYDQNTLHLLKMFELMGRESYYHHHHHHLDFVVR